MQISDTIDEGFYHFRRQNCPQSVIFPGYWLKIDYVFINLALFLTKRCQKRYFSYLNVYFVLNLKAFFVRERLIILCSYLFVLRRRGLLPSPAWNDVPRSPTIYLVSYNKILLIKFIY